MIIETYWNVKICCCVRPFPSALCDNRNILECKVYTSFHIRAYSRSDNRNILECKEGKQTKKGKHDERVIIETYWNVKLILFCFLSFC